ncbi:MAG: hypothetical protein KC996_04385 [Phycisphaerales bacterium]|nr:hypothetical protein [Phycisphaerales bacterium]
MEIYDNQQNITRRPATHTQPTLAVAAAPANEAHDPAGYWKFCSAVLGVALLIAIVLGTGPGNASASDAPDMTARSSEPYRHPALVEPVLTIGGFDAIEGVPVFVMVDQTGQRVGVMEMPAKTND